MKIMWSMSKRLSQRIQSDNEVAESDDLASDKTSWAPPKPLKLGEIYTWTVVAVVDGKEVVSPGPAVPEIKSQVLSASLSKQLDQITRTRSQVAAAIFYAKVGMTSLRALTRNLVQ